jgi:diguanylate cyclase (GGDEF)-like protein/PAS domain S-box-containing protein
MHGLPREDLAGLTFGSHIDADLRAQHEPAIRDVLAGRRSTVQGACHVDGRATWFRSHLTPDLDDAGRQRGFYVVTFDITSLKTAELERARSEERMRDLTDALPVLIAYVDAAQRMVYVNEAFCRWIGVARDQLIGNGLRAVIGPELYAERRDYVRRCLAGERVSFEVSSAIDGRTRHLQTTYLPDFGPDGTVVGLTTVSVDVTDRIVAEKRLALLAHSDTLTGLPNRLQFNIELARALQDDPDGNRSLAILFLDVDRFKTINDTHGHAVGDQVLREFGTRVRHALRPTDFVARLAGDEFVVILAGLRDPCESERIAGKIVEAVAAPFQTTAGVLVVTASIGVAVRDAETGAPDEFLAKADAALYRAKEAGRNTFRLAA